MSKVGPETLHNVQVALNQYREEVEETNMTRPSKDSYIRHAEHFVRWLGGTFTPGATRG